MSSARIRYQTLEVGDVDLHVRSLRDTNQFMQDDGFAASLGISEAQWPLFGVLWPAGHVMMHMMQDYSVAGRRVLEVGCGIGLSSLLLNHRHEDITATDYHPEVESFLRLNAEVNGDEVIPFMRTGWNKGGEGLGIFDLILGSDVLYERAHVALLSQFVERLAAPRCEVIIVDAGRSHCGHFARAMQALGYEHDAHEVGATPYLEAPFRGRIHRFVR